ncbi:MAG: ABC transporter substrate-binding protein [Chloroflexi bacterium]|nr:ABC transporter substrate-binding protein [Chloroflexota bacterium]
MIRTQSCRPRAGAVGRVAVILGLALAVAACQAAAPTAPAKPAEKPPAAQPAPQPAPVAQPAAKPAEKPASVQPAKPAAQAPKPVAKELKKIVFSTAGAGNIYAPLHIALFRDFFKEEGLDAELIEAQGAPQAGQMLLAGNAQLGFMPVSTVIDAVQRNQPVVAVFGIMNQNVNQFGVSKAWAEKQGLTTQMSIAERMQRLKGAKVGIVSPKSGSDDVARFMLREYGGLDPDRDTTLLPLGASPNFPAALAKGQMDAFSVVSPAVETMIVRDGAVLVANLASGEVPALRGQLFIVAAARRETLDKQSELIVAALRALLRGQRFLHDHSEEARQLLWERKFRGIERPVWDLAWKNHIGGFAKSPVMEAEGYRINFTLLEKARGEKVPEIPFDKVVDNALATQMARAAPR